MFRRVFFSFHFDRDNWRANQVRNSWLTQNDRGSAGYIDSGEWEELKRKGDSAIKRWIRDQMTNASVTAVLIGRETAERDWVQFEIEETLKRGMGLVGVRIHGLKDQDGRTDLSGSDPLTQIYYVNGNQIRPSRSFSTYDWKLNRGYANFGNWVEQAARKAGR